MMMVLTTWFVAAWLAAAPSDEPSQLAKEAVAQSFAPPPPPKPIPKIAFEIREITVASPDWRGKMLARLEPITRQEGVAVWAVDDSALDALLKACQADARANVATSPRMVARVGESVRMTNETAVKYVAHLKRISDGEPNQGTRLAFNPEVGEVHDGVRVNVASSRLQGQVLFARIAIEQNQVVSMLTTTYRESIVEAGRDKEKRDAEIVKTSLLDKLRPEPSGIYALNGTIQVPEVISRRIEGEWLIPSDGALLVSMGPTTRRDKALRPTYQERLIAVTARLEAEAEAGAKTAAP